MCRFSKTDSKNSLDGSGGEMQDTAIQAGSSRLDRCLLCMRRPRNIVLGLCLVIAGVPAYLTWAQLARTVDARLRQGPLGNSVSIYAAPHTLTAGEAIEAAQVAAELQKRGYTESAANAAGYYRISGNQIEIHQGPMFFFRVEPAVVWFRFGNFVNFVFLIGF